jgi:cyclopropane fatty-acyl-phospholipid synthase-like methyltransferase
MAKPETRIIPSETSPKLYSQHLKSYEFAKHRAGGKIVLDLGCGDGRMLILAAQKYGCRGIGYDIDPERVRISKENVTRNHVENW